jgi:hypothetical protein
MRLIPWVMLWLVYIKKIPTHDREIEEEVEWCFLVKGVRVVHMSVSWAKVVVCVEVGCGLAFLLFASRRASRVFINKRFAVY